MRIYLARRDVSDRGGFRALGFSIRSETGDFKKIIFYPGQIIKAEARWNSSKSSFLNRRNLCRRSKKKKISTTMIINS